MTAGRYNIVVERGATFDRTLTWYTDLAQQVPKNLTGYTAAMEIRKSPGETVILTLATGSGITLGGTLGTIAILITVTQTNALAAGRYRYDMLLISGTVKTRLFEGECEVRDKITT